MADAAKTSNLTVEKAPPYSFHIGQDPKNLEFGETSKSPIGSNGLVNGSSNKDSSSEVEEDSSNIDSSAS